MCYHIIVLGVVPVSYGRKIQDVFSGFVHLGKSPEAAHVDCVETGWCVRLPPFPPVEWSRVRTEKKLHGHSFY